MSTVIFKNLKTKMEKKRMSNTDYCSNRKIYYSRKIDFFFKKNNSAVSHSMST